MKNSHSLDVQMYSIDAYNAYTYMTAYYACTIPDGKNCDHKFQWLTYL